MATIAIPARILEDHDDCLAAACDHVRESLPDVDGWDLAPRWDSDERAAVIVDVPDVVVEDYAEALLPNAAEAGDMVTVALCRIATAGDLATVDLDDVTWRALERLGVDPAKITAGDAARRELARMAVLG